MTRNVLPGVVAIAVAFSIIAQAKAVRIMTDPATQAGDPAAQFDNIALTPDGTKIVATGLFNTALNGDRVYSLTIPSDPTTQTATITQLSTNSFLVNNYDAVFAPVVSPDGQKILYTHDGGSNGQNTIYTMPIAGEGSSNFTGLFGVDPNTVSPGNGDSHPIYSPDGSKIYFLNNNAGFGGSIPIFSTSPTPFDDAPDWDLLYSIPAGGGSPTALTMPSDGDIDGGLFAVTPDGSNLVYSPAKPVAEGINRSGIRSQIFTVPSAGGNSTEIPLTPTGHDFFIKSQLSLTADGQNVLFISDYETVGKNELFSVPLSGGTPTRISDNLPFAGDVYSFAIAPNGNSVAYAAGQNASGNSELFLTPIIGGTGNSIRVSEPAPVNSGDFDVSTSREGGQILFSADSSKIYYLGDMNAEDVNDLYVVDTSAKAGLVPSPFFFVGPENGDFFDEANWQDAHGNNPEPNTINPATPIHQALIIDGDTVGTSGGEADFQVGGSLELTPGSVLNFPDPGDELDFNPGAGLKLTDATINVFEDIFLEGTNHLSGGLIQSLGDDIEFQDGHETMINGTTFRTVADGLFFENSATSIVGAAFEIEDRLGMRYEIDITVTDTSINVRGADGEDLGGNGQGDVEDAFTGPQGAGSTLTLRGASSLLANAIQDGVSLALDGTSIATLLGDVDEVVDLVDPTGTITFLSAGAEMSTLHASASDVRARIINGLTGQSYLDDPTAWNITNWNGMSPIDSLRLLATMVAGDFDGDGDVDGSDFLAWQRGDSPDPLSAGDLQDWQQNYGASHVQTASAVPEPHGLSLLVLSAVLLGGSRSSRYVAQGDCI